MKITKSKIAIQDLSKPDTIDPNGVLQFPKYLFGGSFDTCAERHYEGWFKGYRVIAILFTRRKGGSWGEGKLSYLIDKEKKIYKTCEDLCEELNKRTLKISA